MCSSDLQSLGSLIGDTSAPAEARIQALWLYRVAASNGPVPWVDEAAASVLNDPSAWVRKNALRVATELASNPSNLRSRDADPVKTTEKAVIERMADPDGRVRINALMAAGSLPPSRALADAVVAAWPNLKDRWLESAAVGAEIGRAHV